MKTALVTGISGQDGSYLADLLLAKGYRVAGVPGPPCPEEEERLRPLAGRIDLVPCDLLDGDARPGQGGQRGPLAPQRLGRRAGRLVERQDPHGPKSTRRGIIER